jgi:hypothetical protein
MILVNVGQGLPRPVVFDDCVIKGTRKGCPYKITPTQKTKTPLKIFILNGAKI